MRILRRQEFIMKSAYTLLLVEDEQNILYGMKNAIMLHAEKISEVLTAENGKQALEILKSKTPDIIITDIRMPEMDGVELVQQIRTLGFQMPVIILTAMADFEIARKLIPYKIQNYIVKPFSMEDVLQETDHAIEELKKHGWMKQAQKIAEEFPELVEASQTSGNQLVTQAISYIREHMEEATSLHDISKALHVSNAYLSTLFKKEMNLTITDFVTKQRLTEAKKLLLETEMQVTEIYQKVGYQSDKYFIKVFKECEGVTPIAFRKRFKTN